MRYKRLQHIRITRPRHEINIAEKHFSILFYWTTEHLKEKNAKYQPYLKTRIEASAQILNIKDLDEGYYLYSLGENWIRHIDGLTFNKKSYQT